MLIDKDSIEIKIGNESYVSMGQYLVEAEYQYNKLWSDDSGRNLAGKQSGTLVGIFPKLVLQFRKLTKAELEIIIPILDSARQKVKYYDPFKKATTYMDTYTGNYSIKNIGIVDNERKNQGFSCSFIAIERRK